jgi:hypothetical protein
VNLWRWYWAFVIVGLIGVPEVIALIRSRRGDTLSEAIWYWCKVTPGRTVWTWNAVHILAAAFLVWLVVHLMTGYWR